MKTISNILALCIITILAISCEKNPTNPDDKNSTPAVSGIIIANEGNFGQSNASLSFFDLSAKKIYNDVFDAANSDKLGDTASDLAAGDSLALVVINGSDKVEVIHSSTFKRVKSIHFPAGSAPVHIAAGDNGDYYVSTLYTHYLYRIDGKTLAITDSIQVGLFPDEVLVTKSNVFVSNSGFGSGNTVSVVDAENMEVITTLHVGYNPQAIASDAQGNIHVVCTGNVNQWDNPDDDIPGGIWRINGQNLSVIDSLKLETTFYPGVLSISPANAGYFIYQNKIVRYDAANLIITDPEFIVFQNGQTPYHLIVEDNRNSLYVLDAGDYVSRGDLIIVDLTDQSIEKYEAGIIPGSIAFKFD